MKSDSYKDSIISIINKIESEGLLKRIYKFVSYIYLKK